MGHLDILGAIVPAGSQKESAHIMGSCEFFLKCVTITMNIFFHLNFVRRFT